MLRTVIVMGMVIVTTITMGVFSMSMLKAMVVMKMVMDSKRVVRRRKHKLEKGSGPVAL